MRSAIAILAAVLVATAASAQTRDDPYTEHQAAWCDGVFAAAARVMQAAVIEECSIVPPTPKSAAYCKTSKANLASFREERTHTLEYLSSMSDHGLNPWTMGAENSGRLAVARATGPDGSAVQQRTIRTRCRAVLDAIP